MANRRGDRPDYTKLTYIILALAGLVLLMGVPVLEVAIVSVLLALTVLLVAACAVILRWGSNTHRSERRDVIGQIIKFVQEGYTPPGPLRHAQAEVQAVADQAMARAGHVISEQSVHLHDIGLLAYDDIKTPKIYRTSDIPTDAAYLRPFVLLTQPEMPGASGIGVLRFSLIDGSGKLRFTSRARYKLHPGQNFVTPPTWLPLDGQHLDGQWTLHVMLGERPLGIINFDWLQVGGALRAKFNGDGEIDARTLRQLGGPAQAPLSLDELLADQGEDEVDGIAISTSQAANSHR